MSTSLPNYARMFQLIEEVFETRQDADQIQVTNQELKKLQKLHPACLSEKADTNGPVIWVLLFPTSQLLMEAFLAHKISEKALLSKTKMNGVNDCIYLCSATTLPEYRNQGETKRLAIAAIQEISKVYPIKTLFVWPFTKDGLSLAKSISKTCGLALREKSKI